MQLYFPNSTLSFNLKWIRGPSKSIPLTPTAPTAATTTNSRSILIVLNLALLFSNVDP